MTKPLNTDSVEEQMQTIAFYNLENLFDIYNNKNNHDNDFLPRSAKNWTAKRYQNKLKKLGYAISKIGQKETKKPPTIVGICEIENATVIKDLIGSKYLKDCHYDYVHYDSLDERGIDVALLYNTNIFKISSSETFTIELSHPDGSSDYTRDILLVSGWLDGELTHIIVNHWSSRREGAKETEYKRIVSSNKVIEIVEALIKKDSEAKIIVMGDFNDDPHSTSIKQLVNTASLYNPMETLRSYSRGTSFHNGQWNLFDQILISTNYFKTSKRLFEYSAANIFDEDFLKLFKGKYKGSPFRTYVGKRYKGGYSDHFPVYITLKK